ncbi:hypothetical protein D3C72_2255180 [compost metagenome]
MRWPSAELFKAWATASWKEVRSPLGICVMSELFSITGGAATAAADMPPATSSAARTRVYFKMGSLLMSQIFILHWSR